MIITSVDLLVFFELFLSALYLHTGGLGCSTVLLAWLQIRLKLPQQFEEGDMGADSATECVGKRHRALGGVVRGAEQDSAKKL